MPQELEHPFLTWVKSEIVMCKSKEDNLAIENQKVVARRNALVDARDKFEEKMDTK